MPIPPPWKTAGLLWLSRSFFFRQHFGLPVWKVSVDAGLGCPNRDGTLATGGCVFCDPASFSPSRRREAIPITRQIDEGIRQLKSRRNAERFVAYFQPGTNTYTTPQRLREVYDQAIAHPEVVGLIVGTRPDCLDDEVLDLLGEFSQRTWLSIELGLQSIHDESLRWMHRGHRYDAFPDAVRRARLRGLNIGAHVILGLPGESPQQTAATARELARLEIDSVKLHNLHAVRNTPLAEMVRDGRVRLPEFREYVARAVDFLELLPEDCVVDRLSGDAPAEYLIGPTWCLDKSSVRNAIEAEFQQRGTCQGSHHKAVTGGRDR